MNHIASGGLIGKTFQNKTGETALIRRSLNRGINSDIIGIEKI